LPAAGPMIESARTRWYQSGKDERRLPRGHPDLRDSGQSTKMARFRCEAGTFCSKRSIGISREAGTMLDRRGGYEYEDLLACARGELFGPGNAQLPLPPNRTFRSDHRSVCPLRTTSADSPVMTSPRGCLQRAPVVFPVRLAKHSESGDHWNALPLETAGRTSWGIN